MSCVTWRSAASVLAAVVLVAPAAAAQTPLPAGSLRGVLWRPEYTDSLSGQLYADVRTRFADPGKVILASDRDLQNTRVPHHGPLATFDEMPDLCRLLRASFYIKVEAQPSSGGIVAIGVVGRCREVPVDTLREAGASIADVGHALTETILRKVLTSRP
jgi:hypothetical protein